MPSLPPVFYWLGRYHIVRWTRGIDLMYLRLLLLALFAFMLSACVNEVLTRDGGYRDAGVFKDSEGLINIKPVIYGEAVVDSETFDGGVIGACTPGRRILRDDVVNARDMGGVSLVNGATVACGVLYRGAALKLLSARGCAEFAQLGIRTVVDLRIPDERLSPPQEACVEYRARVILAPMPVPTYVSPEDYIADLDAIDSVAAAFDALGDETAYPIYINCYYGRDRTGVLAAVVLLALGASRQDVIVEYELSSAAGLTTYPASLEAVLDEIERRGGVEAYLASAGISADQIATLRARATVLYSD
jgi:hypothetical protein